MASRKGLGKGLNALIPTGSGTIDDIGLTNEPSGERIVQVPVDSIVPNRFQPRRDFNEDKLEELAGSIKEHGMVQPIVVRKEKENKYEIVAGERRWRACRMLGMETVPAVVKEYSKKELTEIALIENIQREDLNVLEEASAYQMLIREFNFTQEELARKLGKSRPYVANMLRLLALERKVQEMLEQDMISAGHARTLLGLEGLQQIAAAEKIVQEGLSVRQTEGLVKQLLKKAEAAAQAEEDTETKESSEADSLYAIFMDVEESLREALGTQVRIKTKSKDKGRIEIEYYGHEELERIIDLILNSGSNGL